MAGSPLDGRPAPRIAVIGAGIGGASAAYFARKLFGPEASIDVFERTDRVGGRLRSLQVGRAQQCFEAGGSIIHPRNRYMACFASELGLERVGDHNPHTGLVRHRNGKVELILNADNSAVTAVKMFWRYGYDIFRLQGFIRNVLANFDNIYDLQERGYAFTTPRALLQAIHPSFPSMLDESIAQRLRRVGFSERFIEEFAMAIMRVNYGQTVSIGAFVGAVSLAGAEKGLWAVRGGNALVAEKLLERAGVALHFRTSVNSVAVRRTGGRNDYVLISVDAGGTGIRRTTEHDIVIVAAPFVEGQLLLDLPSDTIAEPRSLSAPYQQIYSTFVEGELNYKFLGLNGNSDGLPNQLLSVSPSLFWNSVAVQRSTTHRTGDPPSSVWKVFSPQALEPAVVRQMFSNVQSQPRAVAFMAYPKYSTPTTSRESSKPTKREFVLHDQVFYVNAIESAASAMEMSVIGARNAALLAHHLWTRKSGAEEKIDCPHACTSAQVLSKL